MTSSEQNAGQQSGLGLLRPLAVFAVLFAAGTALLVMLDTAGSSEPALRFAPAIVVPVGLVVFTLLAFRSPAAAEFSVAGRAVDPISAGLAGGSVSIPAALLLALVGLAFAFGHDGLAYGLGLMSGVVIAAVVVGPRLRVSGAATIGDFLQMRFGRGAAVLGAIVISVVSLSLLAADLSLAGVVTQQYLGAGYEVGIVAAGLLAAALAVICGVRGVIWSQGAFYIVLAGALLTALAALSWALLGPGVPFISYGAGLNEVSALETRMLEGGIADLKTFRPQAKAFLDLDVLNYLALFVTLGAGVAALPSLDLRFIAVADARTARLAGAWSAFFVLLVLISVPALAVLAKLGVLRLIVGGTAFAALPAWMGPLSEHDLVRIHGVSVAMLRDALDAVQSGATDVAGVTAHLKSQAAWTLQGWMALKPVVKEALFAAARASASADLWDTLKSAVLPAAALAAGNKTGLLTHSGLAISPQALSFVIAGQTHVPTAIAGLLAAGSFATVLATGSGLMLTIGTAVSRSAGGARIAAGLATLAAMAVAILLLRSADLVTISVASLAIAASALFPVLALGLWWRRTSSVGAILGMAAGFVVAAFYAGGTQLLPVSFYELWPGLSNASEPMIHKFASLQTAFSTAVPGEAREAAGAALQTLARGTADHPGLANWFGVRGSSAALFGLPIALVVTLVASVLTRSRARETR